MSDIFHLTLLLELFNEEKKPKALKSIKTISQHIFTPSMPALDLSWMAGSFKSVTLEERLILQVEVAKALKEMFLSQTRMDLLNAANVVLAEYKNPPPPPKPQVSGTRAVKSVVIESVKAVERESISKVADKRVNQSLERLKPLQADVLKHVQTMYKEFGLDFSITI